jgi:hypothetical protein
MKNATDLKAWMVMKEFMIILIDMEVISITVSAELVANHLD